MKREIKILLRISSLKYKDKNNGWDLHWGSIHCAGPLEASIIDKGVIIVPENHVRWDGCMKWSFFIQMIGDTMSMSAYYGNKEIGSTVLTKTNAARMY